MNTPDLVQELGFRVLDEEDDDPVLLRADGTPVDTWREGYPYGERLAREIYDRDKRLLQIELLKLQYWVKRSKQRLVIVFEGRDAAGKGGTIKRFMEHLNPRGREHRRAGEADGARADAVVLPAVRRAPAGGRRDGAVRPLLVQPRVRRACDGVCDQEQYEEFMRQAPEFERMLVRSGILLVKLWFSVSQAEQQTRFTIRQIDPVRQWKLSPTDLASLDKWEAYTEAKEAMFHYTDTPHAPWTVVKSNDKKRARLEAMRHVLSLYNYTDKDEALVGHPDPKLLGPAAQVLEHGESATRTFPSCSRRAVGAGLCGEGEVDGEGGAVGVGVSGGYLAVVGRHQGGDDREAEAGAAGGAGSGCVGSVEAFEDPGLLLVVEAGAGVATSRIASPTRVPTETVIGASTGV